MLLTKEGESIIINQEMRSAQIRELTLMAGINIKKKTSINLHHQLDKFNSAEMDKIVEFEIGQTVDLGEIIEIRLADERDNKNYPVELKLKSKSGDNQTIDYRKVT